MIRTFVLLMLIDGVPACAVCQFLPKDSEYNLKGKVYSIDEREYYVNGYRFDKKYVSRMFSLFNGQGKILSAVHTELGQEGGPDKTIYDYDNNSRLKQVTFYEGDGKINHKDFYGYNTQGLLITKKQTWFSDLSDTIQIYEYLYNKKNQIVTIEDWYKRHNPQQQNVPIGDWHKRYGLQQQFNYKYDSVGRPVQWDATNLRHNKIIQTMTWTYNEKGDILNETDTGPGLPINHPNIRYDYDEKGNWIKKIDFYSVVTRKITYYP